MVETTYVYITQVQPVISNSNSFDINPGRYKVDDVDFCKKNDFIQCAKCKDYFDEAISITQYHPQFTKSCKDKFYCNSCFDSKFK